MSDSNSNADATCQDLQWHRQVMASMMDLPVHLFGCGGRCKANQCARVSSSGLHTNTECKLIANVMNSRENSSVLFEWRLFGASDTKSTDDEAELEPSPHASPVGACKDSFDKWQQNYFFYSMAKLDFPVKVLEDSKCRYYEKSPVVLAAS